MKILAIDYGEKRIGLAISCNDWISPQPFLENLSFKKTVISLKEIVKKEKIEKIIVGFPKPLRVKENNRSGLTKSFGNQLSKEISIPLEFCSEIFTTKLANTFSYTKKQKKNIDSRAACFILENYLLKK